jgi:protein SCO1/2
MMQKSSLLCLMICPFIFTPGAPAQSRPEPVAQAQSGQEPTGSMPGGDFVLTDHNGQPFRLRDHRGEVLLLFFGYTSCTEACPVILARINSVFKQLGPDRDKALAVFISVDPERDTTHVLRDYVQYFSAHTVALTGKKDEIDAVVKQYGAKYEIEKSDSALGYHINHTTYIYLIDTGGTLRSRFNYTDRPGAIADAVRHLLAGPG